MKIILSDVQLQRLKQKLNENITDNSYEEECTVDLEHYGVSFKGNEINDITSYYSGGIRVTYNISIERRSWGIKDIDVYNISGPSEFQIEVDYYIDDDNSKTEIIVLRLDWENNLEIEEDRSGMISLDNNITLSLVNDKDGNIICDAIHVTVYSL